MKDTIKHLIIAGSLITLVSIFIIGCGQAEKTIKPSSPAPQQPQISVNPVGNETTNQTQSYPASTYNLNVIINPPGSGNVTVSPLRGSITITPPGDEHVTLPGGGAVNVGPPGVADKIANLLGGGSSLYLSTRTYASGTNVTLIATPAPGYIVAYFVRTIVRSLDGRLSQEGGLGVWNPNAFISAMPVSVNTTIDSDTYISVVFFSRQSFWDKASLYKTTSITPGDYFYISVPNRPGIGSWEASYNKSLIALIDTRNIGGSSGNAEFLFKPFTPGRTQIVISGFGENVTYPVDIGQVQIPPPT